MSELVSIVVPVYRTEQYIERCVDSILKQNYSNIEVLLIDDGSPDNSGNICDEIALEDARIRVIHKNNGGLSSARNAGLDLASGNYICFVDSDDYIEKDYVSVLYHLIQKYDAEMAKIDYIEVDVDNYTETPSLSNELYFEGDEVENAFLELRIDSVCVFMYRKQLIGTTRFLAGKTSEDIPFNFELFKKAKRFAYMPVNKYYYYHNPESISNGPLDHDMLNYLYFRKEIYEHYRDSADKKKSLQSEALYARAAMGLMARMALYGTSYDISETRYKKVLRNVFNEHARVFFRDSKTEVSRKLLAILVFYCFPLARIVGKLIKK